MSALYHHGKTKSNTIPCVTVYVLLALYKFWLQIQPKISRKCLQPNISRKKIRLAEPQSEKSTGRSFVTKSFGSGVYHALGLISTETAVGTRKDLHRDSKNVPPLA